MREMASEQFSLCWDNFHKNMSSGMNSLLEHEDFVDVTLAIDGKYLKAHKMVLSVCSPYFRELFKMNPCQHPIVFMKDVSYTAMCDLIQFMYQGEVQISQENLTTFIKTAEALQIKGLTDGGNSSVDSDQDDINEVPTVELQKSKKTQSQIIELTSPPAKRQRVNNNNNNNSNNQTSQQQRQKDEEISTTISKTESSIITDNSNNDNNSTITTTQNKEEIVQFKLEPYDQNQSITINDDNDETFNDDPLDDKNGDGDVTDDYPIIEGGDDEPKAGTSDEMPGESQEYKRLSCKARAQIPIDGSIDDLILTKEHNHPPNNRCGINIKDEFVREIKNFIEHNPNVPIKEVYDCISIFYLGCADYKRSGCRGRATIPVGGTLDMLKMTQPHNHPPDINAKEKDAFIQELKEAVRSPSLENVTVKKVYETIAAAYPNAAEEVSFRSLSSSLRRWRRDPYL